METEGSAKKRRSSIPSAEFQLGEDKEGVDSRNKLLMNESKASHTQKKKGSGDEEEIEIDSILICSSSKQSKTS